MKSQNRKFLLLIDNCPAHPRDIQLSNVRIEFLPPNTTSVVQPMDQGIIRCLKAHYRKLLLRHLLVRFDSVNSVSELCESVNMLHAIQWLVQAWKDVPIECITNCFKKGGFVIPQNDERSSQEQDDSHEDETEDPELFSGRTEVRRLCALAYTQWGLEAEADEYLSFDDDVEVMETYENQDQLLREQVLAGHLSATCNTENESENEDETDREIPEVSSNAAMAAIETLKNFLAISHPSLLNSCCLTEHKIADAILERKINGGRQQNITDYFLLTSNI